jgi:hypothetical protein
MGTLERGFNKFLCAFSIAFREFEAASDVLCSSQFKYISHKEVAVLDHEVHLNSI